MAKSDDANERKTGRGIWPLPVLGREGMLLLLTWAAGSVDAISYLGLGHVFTAMMTGNTVFLGLAIGQRQALAALRSVIALGGFCLGAAIGALIVWAGRKYLPGLFQDRTAAIQKAMEEAQKASEEARRRLAEIESRLQKLDVEIGMMRNAAEKEAAAEETRIQAAAEEEKNKIVAAAEQEIAAAAKAARRQLTAHAADLAVGLAQKQIRVDAPTDQALVRNFARELGTSGDSGKDRN
jgi:F-type H+-transporting ATPase subunit b